MAAKLTERHQAWLDAFVAAHGRAPRVLHVGNVANNAFNNAKVLNEAGIDSDVVCYDYYHIMGCPEWEDADCDVRGIDQMKPQWYRVDLQGYQRPNWFAQGPMGLCLAYLQARRGPEPARAEPLWQELLVASGVVPPPPDKQTECLPDSNLPVAQPALAANSDPLDRLGLPPVVLRLARICRSVVTAPSSLTWMRSKRMVRRIGRRLAPWAVSAGPIPTAMAADTVSGPEQTPIAVRAEPQSQPVNPHLEALITAFADLFPDRPDQLSREDLLPYGGCREEWARLCALYDLVIGYSTDGIYPLLADKRPYIAFEHGTIRDIPFAPTGQGRVAALTYAQSDAVFMTNADSLPQARRLHAKRIIKGLHGFNWPNMQRRLAQVKRADLQALFGLAPGIKTFIAPARQQWRDGPVTWQKGNDRIVRAVHLLAQRYAGQFKVILVAWGGEVELTRQLIAELGVESHVLWIDPVPKADLWALYLATDCVLDQFILTCIGGVTMEALALGTPIITALDDATMTEFYGETIPLLNAQTVDEIATAMAEVIEGTPRARAAGQRSHGWFHAHHTGDVVLDKLLEAICAVVPVPSDPAPVPSAAGLPRPSLVRQAA